MIEQAAVIDRNLGATALVASCVFTGACMSAPPSQPPPPDDLTAAALPRDAAINPPPPDAAIKPSDAAINPLPPDLSTKPPPPDAAAPPFDAALPPVPPLLKLDSPCKADAECGSGMCRYGKCTRPCAAQGDCPLGFDCGLQKPGDEAMGGLGPTCYKAKLEAQTAQAFGVDCALISPDPKTGAPCDAKAKSPCAPGFFCRSRAACDPPAYCTRGCAADADCPPSMFCGNHLQALTKPIEGGGKGADCKVDADCQHLGMKCLVPPGGNGVVKVCMEPPVCLRRGSCSPCGVSDQCPAGYVCARDAEGERFCGKLCRINGNNGPGGNCPPPAQLQGLPLTLPYQACVDAGDGSARTVCRPVGGVCQGPSVLPGQMNRQRTNCSPCRPGVPGDCPNGFCYQSLRSSETSCTTPCTVHAERKLDPFNNPTVTLTNDTCADGTHGYGLAVNPNSDVTGVCTGDPRPVTTAANTYYSMTCYPLPQK